MQNINETYAATGFTFIYLFSEKSLLGKKQATRFTLSIET